jgi:quinol-cytochrome oxidoreductase complex cytochrome b subunit
VRTTHRLAGGAAVVLAFATLVLLVGRRIRTGGRGIVAGVVVLATALAASITGYLLPWDQLALWAVTVGSNVKGVQATYSYSVKFILIGSREVSPGTYHFWSISHVVVGVLVAVAVVLAWLRTQSADGSVGSATQAENTGTPSQVPPPSSSSVTSTSPAPDAGAT